MVANFRCSELKDEALETIKEQVDKLKKDCDKQIVTDFADRTKELLRAAVSHYDEFAHSYEQTVYNKIRKEVAAGVLNMLFVPFENQLKSLRYT